MRNVTKTSALMLLPLVLSGGHAVAAENEPKIVTLSCDGTLTGKAHEPKPIEKMGVVANLNERTVSFIGFIAPIGSADEASINFNGEQIGPMGSGPEYTTRIDGILDRVTGHMIADTMTFFIKRMGVIGEDHYDLLCKVTNRVF